jgi:hypothetical protein
MPQPPPKTIPTIGENDCSVQVTHRVKSEDFVGANGDFGY